MKYMEYTKYKYKLKFRKWLFLMFILACFYVYKVVTDENTSNDVIILYITIGIISFLLCSFFISWIKKKRYLSLPLRRIDTMEGEEFEVYLKCVFEDLGYRVSLTPTTGDFGADLVCKKLGETMVVQAKRYKNKVGNSAVQEIVAAKAYYKANKCMVVTNSYFTQPAIELAKVNNVELWDRSKLKKIMKNKKE